MIYDMLDSLINPELDNDIKEFNKYRYMKQYVYNKLDSLQCMFDWKNLPKTIPQRNLELMLQSFGRLFFTKVDDEFYVFNGGLGGEPNVYYEPTIFTVANPALNYSAELEVGIDGVLIRNDALMMGVLPICNRYARMLTENDISLVLKSINYRNENIISASDDRTAESARQYLDDLALGKLGIIAEDEFIEGLKVAPVNQSGRNIKDLIEYEQYLRATWNNDLGLDSNFNMKRERIQDGEAEQNKDALLTFPENMLENRREAIEEINEMYDLDLSVDFASAWLKEQLENYTQGVDFDSDKDTQVNEDTSEDIENVDNVDKSGDNLEDDNNDVDLENVDDTQEDTEVVNVLEDIAENITELTDTIKGEDAGGEEVEEETIE